MQEDQRQWERGVDRVWVTPYGVVTKYSRECSSSKSTK